MQLNRSLAAWLAGLALAPAWAQTINVCTEVDDFPPFNFRSLREDKRIVGDSRGSSIAMLAQIATSLQFNLQLQRLPWARCMLAVETGRVDLALDAYYDRERARRFDFSQPYARLTPHIFYYRPRFPDGLPSTHPAALARLAGCGIRGYSYAHYGVNGQPLDQKADTHEQLVEKLKAGRCDYFFEELEVMHGFALTGRNFLADPMLATAPMPDAQAPQLHLLVSRRSPAAQQLKPAIDAAIDKWRATSAPAAAAHRVR